jgi:hypothetical protein
LNFLFPSFYHKTGVKCKEVFISKYQFPFYYFLFIMPAKQTDISQFNLIKGLSSSRLLRANQGVRVAKPFRCARAMAGIKNGIIIRIPCPTPIYITAAPGDSVHETWQECKEREHIGENAISKMKNQNAAGIKLL